MCEGFFVNNGYVEYILNLMKRAGGFAQLHDGFGLVVVEIGVAFELSDVGLVDVDVGDGERVDVEVGSDVGEAGRIDAVDFA